MKKTILDSNATLTGSFHHVKSHQDKTKSDEDLSFPEIMNIHCDQLAGEFYETNIFHMRNYASPHPIYGSYISLNSIPLLQHIEENIKLFFYKNSLHPKLIADCNAPDNLENIDWFSLGQILKKEANHQRMTKCIWKLWHTSKVDFIHRTNSSPECCFCKIREENSAHILKCIT